MKITVETNAADVLKMSKKAADVFYRYNVSCLGCKGLKEEKIGRIAFNYGLDPDKFIKELTEAVAEARE
jgi:hypothetical protein